MLAFGAEDSFNSHACGGKHVAVSFLLAFTARICQVTSSASDIDYSAQHLRAQLAASSQAVVAAALQSDLALRSAGHHSTCVCQVSPAVQQAGLSLPVVCTAGISHVRAAASQVSRDVPWLQQPDPIAQADVSFLMTQQPSPLRHLLFLKDLQQPAFSGQLSTWVTASAGLSGMRHVSRGWTAVS